MFSTLAVARRQRLGQILVLLNRCQVAEPVDFKFSTAGSCIYTSHLRPLVEYGKICYSNSGNHIMIAGACPGLEEGRCSAKRAQSARAKFLATPPKRWPHPSLTRSWRQFDDKEGCFRPSSCEKLSFRVSPVSLLLVLATSCCLSVTIVVTQLRNWLLCQILGGCSSSLSPPLDTPLDEQGCT